ncbi:MAG TPA: ABC transporter permease [Chloroflexota bacterium]
MSTSAAVETLPLADDLAEAPQESPWSLLRRRAGRTPAVAVGLAVIVLLVVMAAGAPLLARHDPLRQDYNAILQAPDRAHPLGTDNLGRDVMSRLIYGARVSLEVGMVAVGIATAVGIAMGLVAGYFGGWVDDLLMRIADAVLAFPGLLLVLAVASALGPSIANTMIAIGVVSSPSYARLLRGQVLSLRELDYVTAARGLGVGHVRVMLVHILPNALAPMIVLASLSVSGAILTEATLSFLGVGVPAPTPSWGSMLQTGYQYIEFAPWLSLSPGLAIFVAVLAFNVLGDGLRSALDPRVDPARRGASGW